VGFGYSFTLQVAKESIAARMLAYVIDSYDKCEEYRSPHIAESALSGFS